MFKVLVVAALVVTSCAFAGPAQAEPLSIQLPPPGAPAPAQPPFFQWPQPGGPGSPVHITYSYSNLLDGTFLLLSPGDLRAATEEAFRLWATYAPLHFVERPDSGPPASDLPYRADGHPQVRIGYHPMADLAHTYLPGGSDGLAGDVHFSPAIPWTLGTGDWNYLEVITHELGHAVGLGHEDERLAIMNAFFPQRRFGELGTAFLLPADIEGIQTIYGPGTGSVQPMDPIPEPATIILVGTGVALMLRERRRAKLR